MNNADTQYLDLARHILENGVERPDRTGTGTLSTFGYQMRFNLAEGFPLLTTKKVAWKSVVYELLWFLRGDTNVQYLRENGVRIWDDWRRPYSTDREIIFIEPKKRDYVEFNGELSRYGLNAKRGSIDDKLLNLWRKMMERCYDPNSHNYKYYGAKGTSVSKDWQNPETFVKEVKEIPHWFYKKNDWNSFELDKDYFGANQYGKDTSVWLHTTENNFYKSHAKPIRVTDAEGVSRLFISMNDASRKLGIPSSTLSRFVKNGLPKTLKKDNKTYLGWEFDEYAVEGKLMRLKTIADGDLGPVYSKQWRSWNGIDQIADVIEKIRTNPNSRRLLVNAWNVGELDEMALPPCHFAFQFYVANNRLSCQLYQRSGDVFIGVPFNIASYSLLTHMIAHVIGLEVGEFIHTIGDAHIYMNHIEQIKTQLERDPRPSPTLKIKRQVTNIDDFVYEDFELVGYNPHPAIKGEVAV